MSSVLLFVLSFHIVTLNAKYKIRVAEPFYYKNHNIIQLQSNAEYNQTIDSIRQGDIYFIEFFSHWCGHCKAFKGQYINFAKFIEKYHNNMDKYRIKLFAIDAASSRHEDYRNLRTRYSITGYPTVLLFMDSPTNYIRMGHHGSKYDLYRLLENTLQENHIPIQLHSFPDEYCLNSVVGPHYITDSKGWRCKINQVNQKTKCCDIMHENDYFSICNVHEHCDEYFPCCSDYESCIACCLHTINNQFNGEILERPFHTNDRKRSLDIETRYFSNFTHCRHQCRTSSTSTFEGNVYVDYRRYFCYQKDVSKYEDPVALLKHVAPDKEFEIMVGGNGESCSQVCESEDELRRTCVEDTELVSHINSCTAIKKYFAPCKGGCMFGYDSFLPALGTAQSQKKCYLKATLAKQQQYSCSASDPKHKRLCLCQVS
eukprot:74179_1